MTRLILLSFVIIAQQAANATLTGTVTDQAGRLSAPGVAGTAAGLSAS